LSDDADAELGQDRFGRAQHHWGGPAEPSFRDPWVAPETPQWPPGVLPVQFHDMVFELGMSAGLDPGAQGIATLSAASDAAPKNARFYPYGTAERWSVPPIIWAMIHYRIPCGSDGCRGSSALGRGFYCHHACTCPRGSIRVSSRHFTGRVLKQTPARGPEESDLPGVDGL